MTRLGTFDFTAGEHDMLVGDPAIGPNASRWEARVDDVALLLE